MLAFEADNSIISDFPTAGSNSAGGMVECCEREALMADLAPQWNGRLYGTNTGNVSVSVTASAGVVAAEARFLDDAFGAVVYTLTGTWDGATLRLTGQGQPTNPNIQVGMVTLDGTLDPDGRLVGRWTTTIGTGGSFNLYPHLTGVEAAPSENPDQLHIATFRLGVIRLYREDIVKLIELLLTDFPQRKLAVTYDNGSTNAALWSDEFLARIKDRRLRYLKLSINSPQANLAVRTIIVEFGSLYNEVSIQGENQVWVAGKADIVRKFLMGNVSPLATQYHNWNVGIYQLLLLAMIVSMPSIQGILPRVFFAFVYVIVVAALSLLHTRLIPMSLINMGDRKPSLLRYWPSWVSWFAAILSAVLIAQAGAVIDRLVKAAGPQPNATSVQSKIK